MDKIAIISDIHGNIPALDAVLSDINDRGITRIFCIGDVVGKGPDSDKATDIIKQSCEVVVKGNWDDWISNNTNNEMIMWYRNLLGGNRIDYLKNLPFSIDFLMSGRLVRLFHASPKSVYHRTQKWSPIEERMALFNNTDLTERKEGERQPDVVGYGDIHYTYIQNYKGKTLFNVGSVGNPLDITQASYVIMEGFFNSEELGSFSVQFVRVPYNIDLAINQAKDKNMPDLELYINELLTAQYRGVKK